jgi:transcriptional regulator with XRE-family HTH domain
MSLRDLKNELFKDKKFKKYFEQNKISYEIAVSIMEARILKGMSQEDLAKKVGTKQPSIARLENGSHLPSLGFLEKIAKALGTELVPPRFKFMGNRDTANEIYEIKNTLTFNHNINGDIQITENSDKIIALNSLN